MNYLNVFQSGVMAVSGTPAQQDSDRAKQKREKERETRLLWEKRQGSKGKGTPKPKRRET